jgi:hypothetical protein
LGCPWNIDILEKTIPPVLEFLSFGNQQDQVKEDADPPAMRGTSGQVFALAQTPGPDLAWQDAAMENQAFISNENNCISTSRRARAGWY